MCARFALFSIGWSDLAIRYLRRVFAALVLAANFGVLAGSVEARDPLWEDLPWEERLGVEWFEKRAERGDTEAQLNLAKMYEQGIGTDPDLAQAAKWYEQPLTVMLLLMPEKHHQSPSFSRNHETIPTIHYHSNSGRWCSPSHGWY